MVILFHYFVLFTAPYSSVNLYPYHSKYANVLLFKQGYLGVQFFFIISGFVIFMTLQKCASYKIFLVKRFARLWPSLVACSVITFCLVRIIDWKNEFPAFHQSIACFIPSLTISEPKLWSKLLNLKEVGYMDGSYWSLICEVKFYLIIGFLYFIDQTNFFRNWLIYVFIMVLAYIVVLKSSLYIPRELSDDIQYYFRLILFPEYLIFFTLGIYFFMLFNKDQIKTSTHMMIFLLLVSQLCFLQSINEDIFIVVFVLLFLTFLYKRNWLQFLTIRLVSTIGLISYPLYLLHQHIGVTLIAKFGPFFNQSFSVLIVVPVIVFMLLLSALVNKTIEIPANAFLKRVILRQNAKRSKVL